MKSRLYILSGASASGKTTLLNQIAALDEQSIDPAIRAVRAPKFSERPPRLPKAGEVDDVTSVPKGDIVLGRYDIAYALNNVKYGLRLGPIRELLSRGLNPFIIASDFRVVRQIKEAFGEQAQALYVSSAIDPEKLKRIQLERLGFSPSAQEKEVLAYHFARINAGARLGWWDRVSQCVMAMEEDWYRYAKDAKSTDIRAQKIRAFHLRYIEHLNLFDHVILNYSENKPVEMKEQVQNLLKNIDTFEQYKHKAFPPIFVVAAAPGAGKGTLLEMMRFIGKDAVRIVSKLATRAPTDEDREDGMIALKRGASDPEAEWPEWWNDGMKATARSGSIPKEYDLVWRFLKRTTQYAVSSHEIEANLRDNMPQMFISNMDQFATFRAKWPRNTVFVYLHRLVSEEENREFQVRKHRNDRLEAEARIAQKKDVHEAYIRNIAEFDHVLLNTAFQEDLYDQMFRLLEYYRGSSH